MAENQQKALAGTSPEKFGDFGLASELLKALDDLGYSSPTPIQSRAIPVILEGKDVMGAAQTGTGKTAGYSLPVLQSLLYHANTSMSPARHPVRALVLVPTRELADQVYEDIRKYAKYTRLRAAVVFGGVDISTQTGILRAGTEILIATPGRLLDHIQQKNVNLGQTHILVLDEADRMLDMGFLPDLQRIVNLLPKERQTLLFSATFSSEIRKLAKSFLENPVSVEVARKNATADNVKQAVYHVDEADKNEAVEYLLRQHQQKQVLIFSNTKAGASRLARQLEKKGLKASAIHGDKTQAERMAVLDAFKEGNISVLVATDVAARGLHIEELPCVINFDLPFVAEDYVHRIGRTGRAGATGEAISLCSAKDEKLLNEIEKLIKRKLPLLTIPVFELKKEKIDKAEIAGSGKRSERSPYKSVGLEKKSQDPWFDCPYVPEEPSGEEKRPEEQVSRLPKKPLAALLGGKPKARK
ncbi:DEAD/DEAH box helicase [Oxalobacter aliiformigenes]|mgnify:FL=1|uniref:DEAD-box ATP-dependent RNA helicase RhpA n=1 Tax=Oxalobacter aliiformigenes TaxID=2946593 RepID=A0A9E9LAX3_9BURK|nr:DEAD/DEAH box helicase [Oxalobacter aliiformigenes]WAV90996.1 DEAD/DEAH box helicase [Oxalobacter aliiformigenes]